MTSHAHLSFDPHDHTNHWHDTHHHPNYAADGDDPSAILDPIDDDDDNDGSGLLKYQNSGHGPIVDDDDDGDGDDDVVNDPDAAVYAGYNNNSSFDEQDVGYSHHHATASSSYNTAHFHGYNNGVREMNWVDCSSENIPGQIPASIPTLTQTRHGVKRTSESISGEYNVNHAGITCNPSSNSPQLNGSPNLSMQASGAGSGSSNPNKAVKGSGTGSLFFKTKLCIKFRAGTCPYNSNCNFAHGMEELRKPPVGWEEMVASQEAAAAAAASGSGVDTSSRNNNNNNNNNNVKENSSGQLVLSGTESLRFRRTRRCKKFYSEEGCPYGDRCNFLHDDQAKSRESNAISLGPGSGNASSTPSVGGANGANGERPSNWKTRMCNKWEVTGHCPFGQKCNFAHGPEELQMYSGAPVDSDATTTAPNGLLTDNKQTTRIANSKPEFVGSSYLSTSLYTTDGHTTSRHKTTYSVPSKTQKLTTTKVLENWKGPSTQISRIYGDWLEDDE